MTCLAKIIGGGLPIGAVTGPHSIMQNLAPAGSVYQAGTLSGNPIAVAAGLATLRTLIEENPYPQIAKLGTQLATELNRIAQKHKIRATCTQPGGMFTVFFNDRPPRKPPCRPDF